MLDDPLIGRRLANFQIERALGRGGMAQVYYGQDVKLQRPVAIKVIDARYRSNPAYAQRFVREAQAIAKWRHEHIIQIYYADDEDGLYYFVMEYIDGQDLGQLIAQYAAKGGLVPQPEVLRIGRAVAGALDYAHQRGVIHRDVKPSNVLIAQDGRVVLADFGLALAVEQGSMGEVVGSANYAAPEQVRRSAEAVPQSDLYSLGIILYELLTGQVPFDDPSSTAVAIQHLTQPPPPPRELNPHLNEATEAVLLKTLSKSPAERYQTGQALMEAMAEALQTGQPAWAEQVEPPPPLPELLLPVVNEGLVRTQRMTGPPPAVAPVSASKRRSIYVGLGTGLAALLLCTSVLLLALFLWLRTSSEDAVSRTPPVESGGAATGEPTLFPTQPPVAIVPPTEPPTPVTAPTEPPGEAGPASYDLLIAKRGEDSLFVVNLTPALFPLAPLNLGNDKGGITGAAWEIGQLEQGACVTAWKEEGGAKKDDENEDKEHGKGKGKGEKDAPQPPKGLESCPQAGKQLTFGKKNERFWRESFTVYYNQEPVGTCDKEQEQCLITIPLR